MCPADNDPTTEKLEEPKQESKPQQEREAPKQEENLPDDTHTTNEPNTALKDRIEAYNKPKQTGNENHVSVGSLQSVNRNMQPAFVHDRNSVVISNSLAGAIDRLLDALQEWDPLPNDIRSRASDVRRYFNFEQYNLDGSTREDRRARHLWADQ